MPENPKVNESDSLEAEPYRICLGAAKEDLKASKCLLEAKLYPQAIFYMQQSIEKAVKSLGILSGVITEDEAGNTVRHRAIKIYFKMVNKSKEALTQAKRKPERFPRPGKYGPIDVTDIDSRMKELDEFSGKYPDEVSLLRISSSRDDLESISEVLRAARTVLNNGLVRKGNELTDMPIDDRKLEEYRGSILRNLQDPKKLSSEQLEESKVTVERLYTHDFF